MHSQPNQNLLKTQELKYHTNEVDEHKMKMKEKLNTPREANTSSTKLPIAT
jgi:hypothetical protein